MNLRHPTSVLKSDRATSFAHLLDLLHEGTWQEGLHRHRGSFAYRGMASGSVPLLTSLNRLCLETDACPEIHLLRNFRKYAGPQTWSEGGATVWSWLSLAQHHGLPTRLLDWTYSPLVALHFATACSHGSGEESIVWRVDFAGVKRLLPSRFRKVLDAEGADVFTAEILARVAPGLSDLDAHHTPCLIFLEPSSFDQRIVNQFALLSLLNSPQLTPQSFLEAHPELVRRVLIPPKLQAEVRDRLDQSNLTERVLFPGLDGLCRWLTRYYTPNAALPAEGEEAQATLGPSKMNGSASPPKLPVHADKPPARRYGNRSRR